MSTTAFLETLLRLVEFYSPSGSEKAAVGYLVGRMQELHFSRAFADEAGNAVGVMGDGPRQVVLLGHIDTVPGEIPIRVEDSREPDGEKVHILYGRGAVDAKGPLAAFVDATAEWRPQPGWQVVVIGAVGEEADSPGARHVLPIYQPEFAVIGEPSQWDRVTLGYKGSAWARVTVSQPIFHSARQQETASEVALRAWGAIRDMALAFNLDRQKLFDRLLVSLRGMDSGADGFQEWASLQVAARLPLDLAPESWYRKLVEALSVLEIPGLSMEPVGFPIPAYLGGKNNPLVRAFLAGIREAGGQPGFVLKTGTADLNILAPAWGCPAVAYGPGDSSLDHTPEEHIDIDEYRRGVIVLRSVLGQIMTDSRTAAAG